MPNQPPINTNDIPEFTGQIIDIFEDFLASKKMIILTGIGEATTFVKIFGENYDYLSDKIKDTLKQWKLTQ